MAKIVKLPKNREFHFATQGGAKQSRYDWDSWFNGDLLLLEQSTGLKDEETGEVVEVEQKKDFEVPTDRFPMVIRQAAQRRYKIVQISSLDADGKKLQDAFIIRARDMNDEERVKENERRAKHKEYQKSRKAAKKAGTNGQATHEEESE